MTRKSSIEACVNCGLPAHSPIAHTPGRGRLQAFVDSEPASSVHLNSGQFQPDSGSIRHASRSHQDIGAR
jgi:hypothetical protein